MHPTSPSTAFIWRRVHSLMGFWLVLYVFLHLLTNSQAALWISEDGSGFVSMVNSLESLPYLHEIEILLIGIPLAVHLVWGLKRLFSAKINVLPTDGKAPSLKYERNFAYTLQRISSWILLFGILGHVAQMRFIDQPKHVGAKSTVIVTMDPKLPDLAQKLGVILTDTQKPNEVLALAPSPGAAMLLMVRDTFKSPLMCALYTIFVLAAAFHAFNGFWTFLITWGMILSYRSQKAMIPICMIGTLLLSFFGLAAIYGSYWLGG